MTVFVDPDVKVLLSTVEYANPWGRGAGSAAWIVGATKRAAIAAPSIEKNDLRFIATSPFVVKI